MLLSAGKLGGKADLGWRVINIQTGSPISLVPCCFSQGEGLKPQYEHPPGSLVAQLVKKRKKKSTCSAGDTGSIPGLGRSPGEGVGHPLQCFWPSLVAQRVKNLPAIQETWVQSLGWEDPLEEGTGNPLQYSCLENPMDRGAWWATAHGVPKSWTRLIDQAQHST